MNVTALNISADVIRVLAVNGKSAVSREFAAPPGSIKNGLILEPLAFGKELGNIFRSAKLPDSNVICSVNGLPFSYRIITLPEMPPAAFTEAVIRNARKEMSISPDEMYLSWQAYPGEDKEWQVLVAGITRHPVDSLIKALTSAGIRPWLMDLPHLALARLAPPGDSIIIDIEKDFSNIVLIADGVPRGMHMVPSLAPGASLQDRLAGVTDRLAKMVEFYNGSHPAKPVNTAVKLLAAGELVDEDEKALDYLRAQSGYPVEPLNPADKLLSGLPVRRYAVNAGSALLAERLSGKGAAPARYFSLEQIIKDARPKIDAVKALKRSLVSLGLAVGITILVLSLNSQNKLAANIDKLKAESVQAGAALVQKQNASARAKALEKDIASIETAIEAVKEGRARIFDSREYVGEITAISASIPKGLTFTSLDMGYNEISLQGVANTSAAVIQFADNLEKTGGFASAIVTWIDQPHTAANGKSQPELAFKIKINR